MKSDLPKFTWTVDDEIELALTVPVFSAALLRLVDQNRDHLSEWMPWVPHTNEGADTLKFIQGVVKKLSENESLNLTVLHEGKIVGLVGFNEINCDEGRATIGYWLEKPSEGKGIMTRSVESLIKIGQAWYGITTFEIRCATGNIRSQEIPKRLGFVETGIIEKAEQVGDNLYDHFVYQKRIFD